MKHNKNARTLLFLLLLGNLRGYKKVHGIKSQSVAAPNRLVTNLFRPVEGRRYDSAMLARSGLLQM